MVFIKNGFFDASLVHGLKFNHSFIRSNGLADCIYKPELPFIDRRTSSGWNSSGLQDCIVCMSGYSGPKIESTVRM